jgi:Predicted hydrolases or acyltransferases (alpha/beta hydrolase superfamily)
MDRAYLVTLQGTLVQYDCDPDDRPAWPLWRPGAYLEAVRQAQTRVSATTFGYDFAAGLAEADLPTLVIGTECSALGTDFQTRWHLPLLPAGAETVHVPDAGHRVMVERPDLLREEIDGFLMGL